MFLETERLRLRPLAPEDAESIQLLAGDEAVSATALGIPHPLTEADAVQWVEEAKQGLATGREYTFALLEKSTGAMVGSAGLTLSKPNQRAELGYWIGRPHWGQGYATEAAARLLQFGFEALDLNRIYANHNEGNHASGRILQKLGMRYEGTIRQQAFHRGRFVDLVFYGILKSEYANRQGIQPLIRKAEHIGINVSDMDRSIAWYTQVLGLPIRQRVRLGESTELAFLPLGDTEVELVWKAGPPPEPKREGVVNHLAFRVEDVAATLEHLRRHGVELIHQQPVELGPLGARIAFFFGPDGEKLELFAPR